MATYHGETMVWRTSMLRMQGKAPKGRTAHENTNVTQGRKKQEDGDKTKEKHGMKPHSRPTHKQAHAFTIGDDNKKLHKV